MLLKHFQKYYLFYLIIYFAGTVSGILEPTPNESYYCTIQITATPVIY